MSWRGCKPSAVSCALPGVPDMSWREPDAHSLGKRLYWQRTFMTVTSLLTAGRFRSAVARTRAPRGLPSARRPSNLTLDSSGA